MRATGEWPNEPATRQSRWFRGLGWLCAMLAAWLAFELTANNPWTVVAICSKFGWDDWLTAAWIFRRDPRRNRAVVCSWFFIASGLWKMSVSAFIAMTSLTAIHAGAGPPVRPPDEFIAATLALFLSFGASSALTLVASWLALRSGAKIWLEWRVHQARRDNAWPPTEYCRFNRAGFLLITSFVAVGTPAMLAVALGTPYLLDPWVKLKNDAALMVFMAFFLLLVCLLIAAVLQFKDVVQRRIAASTPEACWHEALDSASEAAFETS